MTDTKKDMVSKLQKDILQWQGLTPPAAGMSGHIGLGPIESAFPNAVFPIGNVHEFLSFEPEQAAASGGFIGGVLKALMQNGSACLWISVSRTLFPLSLKAFGPPPERIIFIDLKREKDVLWATEEALKCQGLAAVVAELRDINFTQSRRLQLAVEKSKVTGFILRNDPLKINTTACAARWQVKPLPSEVENEMPGVGVPRWQVELLKVRNGNPGSWVVQWAANSFVHAPAENSMPAFAEHQLKAG